LQEAASRYSPWHFRTVSEQLGTCTCDGASHGWSSEQVHIVMTSPKTCAQHEGQDGLQPFNGSSPSSCEQMQPAAFSMQPQPWHSH
jgi:hypothetical protein